MNLYYSATLCVFAFIAAIILIDPNVGVYLNLQLMNLWVQIKRQWYLITIGTTVKYQNWKLRRELNKMRKDYDMPE